MDSALLWMGLAFSLGFLANAIRLPPLIGFLVAGFGLNLAGIEAPALLRVIADVGILMMLFTIGLKVSPATLAKREISAASLAHTLCWVSVLFGVFIGLMVMGWTQVPNMQTAALVVFALSFSSTVCAMKVLEMRGELRTRYGRIALGVLVIQDIVAVAFLAAAKGEWPTLYAVGLFGLIPAMPLIGWFVNKSGHDELLPLVGFILAIGGAVLFEAVNMKDSLGALVMGILMSRHPKANELAKSLLGLKDLLLIGFFMMVGFAALPTWDMFWISAGLMIFLPLKFALFFAVFIICRLRARAAFMSSLALTNFSEFGLIVAELSVGKGWLSADWLVILAMSAAMSFLVTSYLSVYSNRLYSMVYKRVKHFERAKPLEEDRVEQPVGARALVVGMGRVGRGAYDALAESMPGEVWGIDADSDRLPLLRDKGYKAIVGDGQNAELWQRLDLSAVELTVVCAPKLSDLEDIIMQLRGAEYAGKIVTISHFTDEADYLRSLGADAVFNYYAEAGVGLAEEGLRLIGQSPHALTTPCAQEPA